jgi:hypothetical protein
MYFHNKLIRSHKCEYYLLEIWSNVKHFSWHATHSCILSRTEVVPCSAELISTAYQPWNSIFLSQQISHSRLISQKNSLPNRASILELRSTEGVIYSWWSESADDNSEAMASHDLWIWHAFFRVAGSNNDINVLNQATIVLFVSLVQPNQQPSSSVFLS